MTDSNHRPTCINYGCDRLALSGGKKKNGKHRYRIHCSSCQRASYGAIPHSKGVIPFKVGKCSNSDGHLGFGCPMDYEKAPWAIGHTEVDHIDGDHNNDDLKNLDELCSVCHKEKGKRAGDYSGHRYS